MCGRYIITSTPDEEFKLFSAVGLSNFPPRYNVAPTDNVPAVFHSHPMNRQLCNMRWGLDSKSLNKSLKQKPLINIRAEGIGRFSQFKNPYQGGRCLIPANGYYEWKKVSNGRQPYLFLPKDRSLFAFAGIWQELGDNNNPSASNALSFAILTTNPSNIVAPLHNRMPVILHPDDWSSWLGDVEENSYNLKLLLKPGGDENFECFPVSRRVNSVVNDDSSCIDPVDNFSALGDELVLPL